MITGAPVAAPLVPKLRLGNALVCEAPASSGRLPRTESFHLGHRFPVAIPPAGVFNARVMSALPKRFFTQEEYALLEEHAEYKSQYVGGEIFAMAGVQPWHDDIVRNLTISFGLRFRGRLCRTHSADVKVRAKAGDLWTYPDLSVVCGERQYDTSANPHSLLNPQAIFEVLSPTTEAFDRGDKFTRYQTIESLTDYVLVASERMLVQHFARQSAGGWLYREFHAPEDVVKLESVEVALPLADIYEGVVFPEAGASR